MVQTILTDGRTSRLYKSLIEGKAIAESISASNGLPGARYPNLFSIYASPRHPHSLPELEKAIVGELERLKSDPITTQELDRAKNTLRADFIKSLDSNTELAGMLSYFETIAGDYRYIIKHMKMIDKITSQDIQRVANKYFIDINKTVATLQSSSEK
ncbi:MAG: Peptidase M16 inactive domain protein [Syntrophus sp. PtaB.Bin001]|nr:MAG: Peptidase M16 inactive domain protein [Syntrophus sp. PtaB.Bin001]